MKAFQLMVFMMLFNFSVFLISGLYIYNLDQPDSDTYDLSQIEEQNINLWRSGFFGAVVWWIFGAIATATVVSYFTKGKSIDGVIYGVFGGTYLTVTKSAYDTFNNILPDIGIINLLLIIYVVMLVLLFVIGLFQLVRGGMDHYI